MSSDNTPSTPSRKPVTAWASGALSRVLSRLDQRGPTRTKKQEYHRAYDTARDAANPAAKKIRNDKCNLTIVHIAGIYVGTENTTGIPGGYYKTEADAIAARDAAPALTEKQKIKSAANSRYRAMYPEKELATNARQRAVTSVAEKVVGSRVSLRLLPIVDRAKVLAEARTLLAQRQVEGFLAPRRTTPWKSDEISHPELTRMRAETIRRYAEADRAHAASRDGFVYVMSHSLYSPGVVKIGHSRDPYKRASQANTNSAEGKHSIKFIRYFKDRVLAESRVHSDLWLDQTQGEHFRVSVFHAIRVIQAVEE